MRILIIDRSAGIVERMTQALSEIRNISGIHQALSYKEAQKLLQDNKYDIVILESDLPANETPDLLKFLKVTSKKTCIIILFTQMSNQTQNYYQSLGVDFFFDKYYDMEKVYEVVAGI